LSPSFLITLYIIHTVNTVCKSHFSYLVYHIST